MSEASLTAVPQCLHFGVCGGCQYQNRLYAEQLSLKRTRLDELLQEARIRVPAEIVVHSGEPYGYRNRIRLRLQKVQGRLRLGYNKANTTEFLPITMCPISAPVLVRTAEALLAAAAEDRDAAFWLDAAMEMEVFCDEALARAQVTLHCAPRTKAQPGSFRRAFAAWQAVAPQVVGAAAIAADARTGPTGRTIDAAGAAGLSYRVGGEGYWITRGGFFQVNRFLVETLVKLVCDDDGKRRGGELAWDLYAGVGLFSRVLARNFERITAVEANPGAASDLGAGLAKISSESVAVKATTVEFLRRAVLDRDRPELVVLDPPRAGAGVEVCELLGRIAPRTIVYVSCDPVTLVRDLAVLQGGYGVGALHVVDLFPQTAHVETVAILRRND